VTFWTSTPDLLAADLPPLAWTVPEILPEGLGILIGRPKLGKSQLALNAAVAVATGGQALGEFGCDGPADVLYADAELGESRVRGRLADLFPSLGNAPDLSRLAWAPPGALPRLDGGLLDRLDEWRARQARPRLVVLDVWQAFRPAGRAKNLNAYEADSAELRPLAAWANERHLTVLLVHHTRRGESADPLEMASGSNAMTSVPNVALLLDARGGTTTLYVRGHDVEQRELALARRDGWWTVVGEAEAVRGSSVDRAILQALRESQTKPAGIAAVIGSTPNYVTKRLHHLRLAGEVVNLAFGQYAAAEAAETSGNSGKSRKSGKSPEREDGRKTGKSGKTESTGMENENAVEEGGNVNDNNGGEIPPSFENQDSPPHSSYSSYSSRCSLCCRGGCRGGPSEARPLHGLVGQDHRRRRARRHRPNSARRCDEARPLAGEP
jgi:hypothetical protein